jgi:DNA polymerase-3 subunit delta
MQIKQQALAQHIKKKIAPIYFLIGQDNYLLQEAFNTIQMTITQSNDCEEKRLSIQSTEDWKDLIEEANSYSLFSDKIVINVLFDKKSIDAAVKKILTQYLNSLNSRCFIIIRAPNIPAKQIHWLTAHEQVVVVVAYPLNALAMKQWIDTQLRNHLIRFDSHIPSLIHQYTQGNMLACAQVIEKIALCNPPNSQINNQHVLEHLSFQCDHSLYELIDACLLGQADKAIQILRQAANNKTEATLVLWMLTQEVRVLIQLRTLLQQKIDTNSALNQLKIWPSRANLYQNRIKQLSPTLLQGLLQYAYLIDGRIKSNFNTQVWQSLECLCLSLSLGKLIGEVCAD